MLPKNETNFGTGARRNGMKNVCFSNLNLAGEKQKKRMSLATQLEHKHFNDHIKEVRLEVHGPPCFEIA
jgi:hypothetical protein